jgi:hypothetical protein
VWCSCKRNATGGRIGGRLGLGGAQLCAFIASGVVRVGVGVAHWHKSAGLPGRTFHRPTGSCHAGPALAGHVLGLNRSPLSGCAVLGPAGLGQSPDTARSGLRSCPNHKVSCWAKNFVLRASPFNPTHMGKYRYMQITNSKYD